MSAYKFGTGTVFGPCEFECGVLVHRIARIVDHNFPPGKHTVVHVPVFCSDGLDICAVSPVPISMVTYPVGILVTKSHAPCSLTDCIQPIERCSRLLACHAVVIVIELGRSAVAFVAGVHRWSRSLEQIVLVLESDRRSLIPTAKEPSMIAVYCSRMANQAIDISSVLAGIGSYQSFDAYRVTSMLEWQHHNLAVA